MLSPEAAEAIEAADPALELIGEDFTPAEGTYEFDEEFQLQVVALQMRDNDFAVRTAGLVVPNYFMLETDQVIARMSLEHFQKYGRAPDKSLLRTMIGEEVAKKRIRKDMVAPVRDRILQVFKSDISGREFVIERVSDFAKSRAIEAAMIEGVELLGKKDYAKYQQIMEAAFQVGALDAAGGYNYGETITQRTEIRREIAAGIRKPDGITTGVKELDDLLPDKGWGRKELSCFMGAAKAGKSMGLGDFARAAWLAGFNVLYASCEVRKEVIADRIDANISDLAMKALKATPDIVEIRVKRAMEKAGILEIRDFPSGTLTPNQLRRVLHSYRQKGVVFDLIVADYPDIMAPDFRTKDVREDSKNIWVAMRAIMSEENAAGLVATQGNREGAKKLTAAGVDVAEDFNKVRTCDVFITINATDDEKAIDEMRLYFSEMRNTESGFTLKVKTERAKMRFIASVIGRE